MMANKIHGTLYVGVTSDLVRRVWEHRQGVVEGFTHSYRVKCLVYFEWYDSISAAIQREKTIKGWPRRWKVELIEQANPRWNDLFDEIAG